MSKKVERGRCFHLILYDEDETHIKALDLIRSSYNYALILHNNDFDDFGEIKKSHYHVIIYLDNASTISALSKKLGIKSNYIVFDEKKKSLEYLIHKNNQDKYQYSIDEVEGTLKSDLLKYLSNDANYESQSVLSILNYIDSSLGLPFPVFIRWVVKSNLWSFYRRSSSTFIKYLDEHNKKYYN